MVAVAGGLLLSGKIATLESPSKPRDQGQQAQPIQLHKCWGLGYSSGSMYLRVSVNPADKQLKRGANGEAGDSVSWKSVSYVFGGPAALPKFSGAPAWALDCLEGGGVPVYLYFTWHSGWNLKGGAYCIADSDGDGWLESPAYWAIIRNFGYAYVYGCAYAWVKP